MSKSLFLPLTDNPTGPDRSLVGRSESLAGLDADAEIYNDSDNSQKHASRQIELVFVVDGSPSLELHFETIYRMYLEGIVKCAVFGDKP